MDPRQKILADIDLDSSKIFFSKKPIVLFCGGHVPEKEHADAPDLPIRSLRDAVTRRVLTLVSPPYIFRPEEIKSWQNDGIFKNLMEFESDLASICSLVAIVIESEGSIAELGAFSQLPDLRKKLIVFVAEELADQKSFINLGILRYIREEHETGVKVYPWRISYPTEIPVDVITDVIDDLSSELESLKKTQAFNLKNDVHFVVLIYEMLKIFIALKESELIEMLTGLGKEVHRDVLRRKLFLLEQFDLVEKITYSDSTFYASRDESFHRLRLATKADGAVDFLRSRIECFEYYKATNSERNRSRAILRAKLGERQ
ncbi:hypothetical protein PS914_01581 [Pseudomonas fluorescens]|uniref:retron St85 family effector protein n=1 Tax=Pseudomonas fluorescens TaxID=294 RepID=UPI00124044F1|nr:retron St85 family effector protein [Pseudomonas fluorescens]VVP74285.1 hypothetical protein PS914_01581 [Pseudomonas fluorescens]